jgi:hypothetical protein
MHDPGTMCAIEGLRDLARDLQGLLHLDRPAANGLVECFPFQVLHDEVVGLALLTNVVQRADMRVTELREGVGLAVEALAKLRIARERGRQDLDGDGPSEAGIVRLVDLTTPPAPRAQDFV